MEVLILLISVIGLSSITEKILRHRREMAKLHGTDIQARPNAI
ncbi:MAG TPA: hypothetical protein PLH94_10720 [Fimbriimonadaceae bacterium]|nr:hypothetical protein [Fimbriimonadaceae bacterium]